MSSTSTQLARAGVITALLVGAYLVALRTALGSGQEFPEAGLTTLTFAALCLAPGVIATIGWRRNAAPLMLAAAIACGLLTVISVAALPFVVPVIALLAAATRGRWSPATTLGATVSAGLFAGAWFSLLLRPDERCVATATSTTCGHIATTSDALLTLVLLAASIGIAIVATRRSPPPSDI
jgi:hypothetical protein